MLRVSEGTLLTAAASSVLAGSAFVFVGRRVNRTTVGPQFMRARTAHAVWWLLLGTYLVLHGFLTALASQDALTYRTYLVSRVAAIPLLCGAVWGLCTYLVFLHTGRYAHRWLGVLYGAVALVFAQATFFEHPTLAITDWLVNFEDDGDLLYQSIYVLVGLPPIVASISYLTLLPRVPTRDQRRRLLLTAIGILAYVGSGLVARLFANDLVVFVTLVPLGLVSAGAVLAAHLRPPGHGLPPVARPAPYDDIALANRMKDLV